MNHFLKENLSFALLVISWVLVGVYGAGAIYLYIPLCIILMKRKGMLRELFLGLLIILVFSDNRHEGMRWAGNIKDIYIVSLSAFLFFERKSFPQFNTFYLKFIPFFLVALFCILYSEEPLTSIEKTFSYLLILMVVPNYISKLYDDYGDKFLEDLVWLAVTLLFSAVVLIFINPKVVYFYGRYSGILGNPNGLGIYTMLNFFLYSTILDIRPKMFTKNERSFIFLIIILTLFASGSRSSILAVFIFSLFKYFYKMSPMLGFVVFLLISVSYQLITDNLKIIIEIFGLQSFFRLETVATGSGRIIAWTFAWQQIQKNLFLGKGFGYTDYVFDDNWVYLSRLGHQGNAHNSYLTMWLETGLVGLIFYFMALLSSFFAAIKKSRVTIPLIYAILFQIFFESWLAASLNPYTILLIIILVVISLPLKEETIDIAEEEEELPEFYPQRFVPQRAR